MEVGEGMGMRNSNEGKNKGKNILMWLFKKESNIPTCFDFVPLSQQTLMAAYSIPSPLLGVRDVNMNHTKFLSSR